MAASFSDATFGSLAIKQCTGVEFNPGNKIETARASGAVLPSEFYMMQGDARARFSTLDLETVLAAIDEYVGLSVTTGTIKLAWNVRSTGAAYASGSNHIYIGRTLSGSTGASATLIPVSLTVSQGGFATLELEVIFRAPTISGVVDPFTSPVLYVGSVAVTSPSFTGTFRMGPTTLDGSAISSVSGYTVNFGIVTDVEYSDGGVWPQNIYILEANPSIDVRFFSQALLNTHGPLFSSMSGAVFSLLHNATGGTVTALASSAHITITLGGGIKSVENISNQGNSKAEPALRLHGTSLAIATGAALA